MRFILNINKSKIIDETFDESPDPKSYNVLLYINSVNTVLDCLHRAQVENLKVTYIGFLIRHVYQHNSVPNNKFEFSGFLSGANCNSKTDHRIGTQLESAVKVSKLTRSPVGTQINLEWINKFDLSKPFELNIPFHTHALEFSKH